MKINLLEQTFQDENLQKINTSQNDFYFEYTNKKDEYKVTYNKKNKTYLIKVIKLPYHEKLFKRNLPDIIKFKFEYYDIQNHHFLNEENSMKKDFYIALEQSTKSFIYGLMQDEINECLLKQF